MPFVSVTAATLLLIASPIIYIVGAWLHSTTRPKNFPPGPRPLLGLGNWHQIPRVWHFNQLHAWAKQYGEIMGLKLGPRNVVILNDASLVHELFVKRATSFSERPPMYIAQNHMDWPQVLDADHSFSSTYGVDALPHTFTIDADGALVSEVVGVGADDIEGRVKTLVQKAYREASPRRRLATPGTEAPAAQP